MAKRTRQCWVGSGVAAACAIVLAGCDRPPRPVDPGVPLPPAPATAPQASGTFRPISALAKERTGALTAAAWTLAFAKAAQLETRPLESAAAADRTAIGGPTYGDLLLLRAPQDLADVRSIVLEAPDAPGLCTPDPAKWVALGESRTESGARHLALAVFTGEQAPSGGAAAVRLCGVFRYLAD